MSKFDLIIIGAGISGLSSALTAVELGLHTAVVEKESCLGGIATDCFHAFICGLFQNNALKPFKIANRGLCTDVFDFLHNIYGDKCLVKFGKVEVIAFIQKDLWNFFENRLNRNNFTLYKGTRIKKTVAMGNKISSVKALTQKDYLKLAADVFIDASGCGLSKAAASEQLGGFSILLGGELKSDLSLLVPYTAFKIVQKYNLNKYLKFVTIAHNFLENQYILKFSVQNSGDIKDCKFIYEKLKKRINELANLKLLKFSKKIHLRDCVSLQEHEPECSNNDSHCVKSYWPLEKWDMNRGTQYCYIKDNKPFLIPCSALKDKTFDNLFLAGKSINVSDSIKASARVMGVCMATGEQTAIKAYKYLKEN